MKKILISILLFYIKAFAKLAVFINKPKIIGITGSVGKSSARNAIYSMMKEYFHVKVIDKGNSETGIPLGILGLSPKDYSLSDWLRMIVLCPFGITYLINTQYLIVEMGIDEPDEPKNMTYLLTIIKPYISVFLNVFPVHTMQFDKTVSKNILDVHKRLDAILINIAKEKGKIITESRCNVGIINSDNVYTSQIKPSSIQRKILKFGKSSINDLYYKDYEINLNYSSFSFSGSNGDLTVRISNFVLPKQYQEIFAAAILTGYELGLNNTQIKNGIEKNFSLPAGRSTLIHGIKNSVIIDSSYNASRYSVIAFLDLAYDLKIKNKRPLVFCFGDMRELGQESSYEHLEVVKKISVTVDYLFCVGPITKKYIISTIRGLKEIKWFANSLQLGNYLRSALPDNAVILVKGSQNGIFLEESIKPILKNNKDATKLCRQDNFWIKKKSMF